MPIPTRKKNPDKALSMKFKILNKLPPFSRFVFRIQDYKPMIIYEYSKNNTIMQNILNILIFLYIVFLL